MPRLPQSLQLVLTPDACRRPRPFRTAGALAEHPPRRQRLVDALDLPRRLCSHVELVRQHAHDGGRYDERARLGELVQPSGDVHGQAVHIALPGVDVRETSVDADATDSGSPTSRWLGAHRQGADGVEQLEPGAHGAAGVVFVGHWVAEQRVHAVALDRHDPPAVGALEDLAARLLVPPDDPPVHLGVVA